MICRTSSWRTWVSTKWSTQAYWFHPRVMRRQVDISTGAVLVAIVVGGALLGVVGAVLAVPMAAAVQLIVREVVVPHQERS